MVWTPGQAFGNRPSLLEMIRGDRAADQLYRMNQIKQQFQEAELPYADENASLGAQLNRANVTNKNITNQYLPQEFETSHASRRANTNLANVNASLAPSKHALNQSKHSLDLKRYSPEQLAALMRSRNAVSATRENELSPEFAKAKLKYMERRGLSNFGKLKADEAEQENKLREAQKALGEMQMGQTTPEQMQEAQDQAIPAYLKQATGETPQHQEQSQELQKDEQNGLITDPGENDAIGSNPSAGENDYSGILQGQPPKNGQSYTQKEITDLEKNKIAKMDQDLKQYKLSVYKTISDPQARRRALSAALLDYTYKQVPMDALMRYTGVEGAYRLAKDTAKALGGEFVPMLAKYRIYKKKIREWGAENLRSFGGGSVHFKNTERLKQIMGDISPYVPPEELLMEIEGGRRLFENEAQIERSALNEPDFYSVKGHEVPGTQGNISNQMIKEIEDEKKQKSSKKLSTKESDIAKKLILEGYSEKDAMAMIEEQKKRNAKRAENGNR